MLNRMKEINKIVDKFYRDVKLLTIGEGTSKYKTFVEGLIFTVLKKVKNAVILLT